MIRRTGLVLVASLIVAACGASSTPAQPASPSPTAPPTASPTPLPTATPYQSSANLVLRPKGAVEGAPAGYAEYLPPGYGDGTMRPLLLFHHGSGENGGGSEPSLRRLFDTGLPEVIALNGWPEDRPFVVLMPQHQETEEQFCPSADEVDDFLTFAKGHYDIDPTRIYLSGLSCGAFGEWEYLGLHTDQVVAAAVLIAGDGRDAFVEAGCDLGRVAIWAFHGELDDVVDPAGSTEPLAELEACTDPKPVDARLTVYPGAGHDVWDRTYGGSPGIDIYAWLLGHSLPD